MEILSIKQIREYIPNCTEIRMCTGIPTCVKKNMRSCTESEKPCYITYKNEELEGTIRIDFKNNIMAVYRLNEDRDYAEVIRPDGVHVKFEGIEPKEKLKKLLKSLMKQQ